MTLGCGAYGGNISSDNITARHLYNVKKIAYGIKNVQVPQPGNAAQDNDTIENKVKEAIIDSNTSDSISMDKIEQIVKQVLKEYQNQ